MKTNDPQHHFLKSSPNMLDKLSNKISAIKDDISEAVRERARSISSDRYSTMFSGNNIASLNKVGFTLQDDSTSIITQAEQLSTTSSEYLCVNIILFKA